MKHHCDKFCCPQDYQCELGDPLGDTNPPCWYPDGYFGACPCPLHHAIPMQLTLTEDEFMLLQDAFAFYIADGNTSASEAEVSMVRKLGLTANDCWPYADEYAEAFK